MIAFLKTLFAKTPAPAEPSTPQTDPIVPHKLETTRVALPAPQVGIFLHWINENTDLDLPEEFIADVLLALPDIPIATNAPFDTTVHFATGAAPLRLNIFMDGPDAPDMRFFSTEAIITILTRSIIAFREDTKPKPV